MSDSDSFDLIYEIHKNYKEDKSSEKFKLSDYKLKGEKIKHNIAKKSSEIECEYYILEDIVNFKLKGSTSAYAMVSLDIWDYVCKYNWYLGKAGYPLCYDLHKLTLHRFVYSCILQHRPPKDLYVDHIDRNKLNNTNTNLRLVTP